MPECDAGRVAPNRLSSERSSLGRLPISGCVISYQEEDRIAACVQSLAFCDEVLVVDSGSTDATRERASEAGARIIVNAPFPGHREQKQWVVDQARNDWVLCLDADERVTDALRVEIETAAASGLQGAAYEMPRQNHYLGRIVRRGLFWPDRKLRLFDRREASWGGTNPHDKVVLRDEGSVTRFAGALEHLSYRNFKQHLGTIHSFTAISAAAMHAEGRRAYVHDLLIRPIAVAVKSYFLKRGFMDGWRGIVIAGMAAYYDFLKYWRLLRLGFRRA